MHYFVRRFAEEGLMPNVKSLIDEEVVAETRAVEGLTEFLTGYVLYEDRARGARRCCEYWVEKAYPPCQISYEPYVRVFAALSRALVPLRALARVYFYDKTIDWRSLYLDFLRAYDLPDLLRNWPSAYELEEEISRALRSAGRSEAAGEFELLVEEDLRELLDYSKMGAPGRASSII